MTVRVSTLSNNPYLGYMAMDVAHMAAACLHCRQPAPCTLACPRGSDIPMVMRLAGHAACEGLALTSWFDEAESIEVCRITDAINEVYT